MIQINDFKFDTFQNNIMKDLDKFQKALEVIKKEGKYRIFNNILRECGKYPSAIWYSKYGVKKKKIFLNLYKK